MDLAHFLLSTQESAPLIGSDGFACRDPRDPSPLIKVGMCGKVVRNDEALYVCVEKVEAECVTATVDNDLLQNEFVCGQRVYLDQKNIFMTTNYEDLMKLDAATRRWIKLENNLVMMEEVEQNVAKRQHVEK